MQDHRTGHRRRILLRILSSVRARGPDRCAARPDRSAACRPSSRWLHRGSLRAAGARPLLRPHAIHGRSCGCWRNRRPWPRQACLPARRNPAKSHRILPMIRHRTTWMMHHPASGRWTGHRSGSGRCRGPAWAGIRHPGSARHPPTGRPSRTDRPHPCQGRTGRPVLPRADRPAPAQVPGQRQVVPRRAGERPVFR